jgi:DNA polymerase-3 subunit delta'
MPLRDFENEFSAAVRSLRNASLNNRSAHAYLLHCDQPPLAENFSKALAQTIACPSRSDDGDACGRCKVCAQIMEEKYPDLFTIMPTSKSRRIKIGKDDTDPDSIRWFQALFYFSGTHGTGKKIGIIHDADCMMPQAQNAFLKTLEEPPPNSHFIICAPNPAGLLPTFRSRCQRITLLRNSQKYDFYGADDLISILSSLQTADKNIAAAENASAKIIKISEALKDKAREKIEKAWDTILQQSKQMESGSREIIEGRLDAAIQAEYLLSRESLLSLIHCRLSQTYQLSKGIPITEMPNPELMNKNQKLDVDEKKALNALKEAESFLQTMKLNVDEKLAIYKFCFSIVFS